MSWLSADAAPPLVSEVELHGELHDPVPELVGHDTRGGCIGGSRAERGVGQAKRRVAGGEPPEWVIEHIERLRPELDLAGFIQLEALEKREVGIVSPWTMDVRDHVVAIMSRCRRLEAGRIEYLLCGQTGSRIAPQQRHRGFVGRTDNVAAPDVNNGTL